MGLRILVSKTAKDEAKGRHFGLIGAPQTMNPFPWRSMRHHSWRRGWLEGFRERRLARQKG